VDYVVARIEQGYGPHVRRFDRHVYMIARDLYVLLDDVELAGSADLTWNFHTPKDADIQIGDTVRVVNGPACLEMVPFGGVSLRCDKRDDHVLPRAQWDTTEPVSEARAGWLLLVSREGEPTPAPRARLEHDRILVQRDGRERALPIVRRRTSYRSALTLIPELGETEGP